MRDKLTEMFDRMMKALFREQRANLEINILASEEAQDFIETHASSWTLHSGRWRCPRPCEGACRGRIIYSQA